jgi:hypothetical protein
VRGEGRKVTSIVKEAKEEILEGGEERGQDKCLCYS